MKNIKQIVFFIGIVIWGNTNVYCQTDTTGIGDRVWLDMNGNGIQDSIEFGLNGVYINLFEDKNQDGNPDGSAVKSTISSYSNSTSGFFHFDQLVTGYYVMQFVYSKNYFPTQFRAGQNVFVDSDLLMNGFTRSIYYRAHEDDLSIVVGLIPKGNIGDYVWNDTDLDGIQDKNESGINGFTIQLLNQSNIVVDQVISSFNPNTGQEGWYEFQYVVPGDYYIKVIPISNKGYRRTVPYSGKNEQLDSDLIDQFGINTSSLFTIDIGTYQTSIDAGFFLNNAIGNYVWRDINVNGIQDVDEIGINGVLISLFDAVSRVKIAETVSRIHPYDGTNGFYYFNNLNPGSYYIRVTRPLLYYFTIPGAGTEDVDSDIDGSNGRWTSATIYILPNTNYQRCDIGLRSYTDEGLLSLSSDELDINYDDSRNQILEQNHNSIESTSDNIAVNLSYDFYIANKQIYIFNRPEHDIDFELFDLNGRLIWRRTMPFDENIPNFFDVPLLSSGIYIVIGISGSEKKVKKIFLK